MSQDDAVAPGAALASSEPKAVATAGSAGSAASEAAASESAASEPESSEKSATRDVMFVHSRSQEGDGYNVIRQRDERIEIGQVRALRDGQPIHGEVLSLTRREEHAQLFDVDVVAEAEPAQGRRGPGPAQVANDAYRSQWDAIFGSGGVADRSNELN